jgi:hypothetical protein
MRKFLLTVIAGAVVGLALVASFATAPASAHRSGCHRWHSCPSDLYTYRWRGLLCNSQQTDKIRSSTRAGRTGVTDDSCSGDGYPAARPT